jgi:hypothetical protein
MLLQLYGKRRMLPVTSGRRVLGYPGPGGYTVSLVIMVAVFVAAAAVAATAPLTAGKAGSCLPR